MTLIQHAYEYQMTKKKFNLKMWVVFWIALMRKKNNSQYVGKSWEGGASSRLTCSWRDS